MLYSAPYSPDLSPIEYAFNVYKSYLKRYSKDYSSDDWYQLHKAAYKSVSKDTAIMEFRKRGIPLSYDMLTNDEMQNLLDIAKRQQ